MNAHPLPYNSGISQPLFSRHSYTYMRSVPDGMSLYAAKDLEDMCYVERFIWNFGTSISFEI